MKSLDAVRAEVRVDGRTLKCNMKSLLTQFARRRELTEAVFDRVILEE